MNRYYYVIIPTINGEINDEPYLYSSFTRKNSNDIRDIVFNGEYEETTIYEVDIKTHNIREVY